MFKNICHSRNIILQCLAVTLSIPGFLIKSIEKLNNFEQYVNLKEMNNGFFWEN